MEPIDRVRELAELHSDENDGTSWFEHYYQETAQANSQPLWVRNQPNPNLIDFWQKNPLPAAGKSALVVGCGFGDDAEQVARWGFQTTAFDIAPSAIVACRERFPGTPVEYVEGDLLNPPAAWAGRFDLIFEAYTLQALPAHIRAQAIPQLPGLLRPGGHLLIVARGRDEQEPVGEMPWHLTRTELSPLTAAGLREVSFEDYIESEAKPVRRFRVLYQR